VPLHNGHILTFDNGNFRSGSHVPFSRVLEIDPADHRVVWSYADEMVNSFFTAFMGNAQRLAGGNTHITESATGRLFEVTPRARWWEYDPLVRRISRRCPPHRPGRRTVFQTYRADQILCCGAEARPAAQAPDPDLLPTKEP
jgi:hypothetical protein